MLVEKRTSVPREKLVTINYVPDCDYRQNFITIILASKIGLLHPPQHHFSMSRPSSSDSLFGKYLASFTIQIPQDGVGTKQILL